MFARPKHENNALTHRRPWGPLGLRVALLLAAACVFLYGRSVYQQLWVVHCIEEAGGQVRFDYESPNAGELPGYYTRLPVWLKRLVGRVEGVSLGGSAAGNVAFLSDLPSPRSLKNLHLVGTPMRDLTLLHHFPNLTGLAVSGNRARELSPLAELTKLESLDVEFADAADLSLLAGLSQMRVLSLTCPKDTDLSPLAGLSSLTELTIFRPDSSSVEPLKPLTQLKTLNLIATQVEDSTPLFALRNLTVLRLVRTGMDQKTVQRLQQSLPGCTVLVR